MDAPKKTEIPAEYLTAAVAGLVAYFSGAVAPKLPPLDTTEWDARLADAKAEAAALDGRLAEARSTLAAVAAKRQITMADTVARENAERLINGEGPIRAQTQFDIETTRRALVEARHQYNMLAVREDEHGLALFAQQLRGALERRLAHHIELVTRARSSKFETRGDANTGSIFAAINHDRLLEGFGVALTNFERGQRMDLNPKTHSRFAPVSQG